MLRTLYVASAGLFCLMVALAFIILQSAFQVADEADRNNKSILLSNEMSRQVERMAADQSQISSWEASYEAFSGEVDHDFIHEEIVDWLWADFDIHDSIVIDPAGEIIATVQQDGLLSNQEGQPLVGAYSHLVDQAVEAYFQLREKSDEGYIFSEDLVGENADVYAYQFDMVDGVVALVVAQAVMASSDTLLPEGRPFVLLTRKYMSQAIIDQIQNRMGIEAFAFTTNVDGLRTGYFQPVSNTNGIYAAWDSSPPSETIWQQTKWIILLGLVTLTASFGFFVARYGGSIKELAEREERSKYRANHDPLTGLSNRAKLDQALLEIWSSKRQSEIAIVMVDLDKFKPINDTWGHEAGDMVLKEVSSRLSNIVAERGLVARMGGDEFVIIVNDAKNEKYLQRLTDKILKAVAGPISIGDFSVQVDASIGVSLGRENTHSSSELMREADHALYVAKNAGRGRAEIVNFRSGKKQSQEPASLNEVKKAG